MGRKIIIAITGASGSVYPHRLIDKLLKMNNQWDDLAVVCSTNAREVWQVETGNPMPVWKEVKHFDKNDFTAPFASGSGRFDTMIIAPCSMGTLGRIAGGISNDLITRAADVVLKERRRLICLLREMPYNLIHIRNMEAVTMAGGVICPATPSFYSRPQTVEAMVDTVVDRVLDLAGFDISTYRWGGEAM
ncbi:MAG: UbiX family flavin prenyltransferase [Niabella sp.]